jgi:hypothetical protein
MTDVSPIANASRPSLSARRRFQLLFAISGFYLFIASVSPILADAAGIFTLHRETWDQIDDHWLYGCIILIAGWVALGPGRMAMRGLQGFIVAGWLLLVWMLGLTMTPNWQPETGLTLLTCAAVAVASFGMLVAVRRCSGRMISRVDGRYKIETNRFQYSLTTLLFVMLLFCVALALFGWIDPRYRNYAQDPSMRSLWHPGGSRRYLLERIGSVTLSAILITAACLPAFLSKRKRPVAWSLGLSVAAFIIFLLMDVSLNIYVSFPLFQNNWTAPWSLYSRFDNFATVTVCLLTAAAGMHWLGYRIAAVPPREMGAGTLL